MMKQSSTRMVLIVGIVLSLILLVACQPPAPPTETGGNANENQAATTTGTTTGTTTTGTTTGETTGTTTGSTGNVTTKEPISVDIVLDPVLATGDASNLIPLLYTGLVIEGGAPGLADSWTVSEDGLTYTFRLHPGLTFSNGAPVDADAVIANFDRWSNPDSPLRGSATYDAWKTAFGGFKGEKNADDTPVSSYDGMEKVDARTVLIHLNRPVDNLIDLLANPAFGIVDPSALGKDAANYGTKAGSVAGVGPYMVQEWTDAHLVLAPNTGWIGTVPTDTLEYPFK